MRRVLHKIYGATVRWSTTSPGFLMDAIRVVLIAHKAVSGSFRPGAATALHDFVFPTRMRISVPTETAPREQRVALAPDSVTRLIKQLKLEVMVQRGAGLRAGFRDEAYEATGATLVADAAVHVQHVEAVVRARAGGRFAKHQLTRATRQLLAEALRERIV